MPARPRRPAHPRPRPARLRHPAAVVVVAAASLLGGAACSSGTSSTGPTTTTTTTTVPVEQTTTTLEPTSAQGRELFVYAPVEGDCIDLRVTTDDGSATTRAQPGTDATPRAQDQLVLRLGCELPHQYEVISVVEAGLPSDPVPGVEALEAAAKRLCPPAFATYVGTPYQSSALELGWVLPSADQLARGVQQIGCLAFEPTGKLTGTVRDTGR